MIFYMMVGIAGCGKSTYAKRIGSQVDTDTITDIISTDEIRKRFFGTEEDQSHNATVFAYAEALIVSKLNLGHNVVFDATNLWRKDRIRLLKKIHDEVHDEVKCVAVVVGGAADASYHNQLATRTRIVPLKVLNRQAERLQYPEWIEGWDYITMLRPIYDEFANDEGVLRDLKEYVHQGALWSMQE